MNFLKNRRKGGFRDRFVNGISDGLDIIHGRVADGLGIDWAPTRKSQVFQIELQAGDKVLYRSGTDGQEYLAVLQEKSETSCKLIFSNGAEKELPAELFDRIRLAPQTQASVDSLQVDDLHRKFPRVPREKLKEVLALAGDDVELATEILILKSAFQDMPLERIKAALEQCAGERSLAMDMLLRQPPDIRSNPEGWFRHFDIKNQGTLEYHDVIAAVSFTFPGMTEENADYLVSWIWGSSDHDHNGFISFAEFQAENGLRDLLLRELQRRRVEKTGEDDSDDDQEGIGEESEAGTERQVVAKALENLSEKGALGIYFTLSIAKPLSRSTKLLEDRYKDYQDKGLDLQILLVSMDRSEAGYNKLTSEHDAWEKVPYNQRGIRKRLAEIFDIQKVPTLVIMDKAGKVITKDGIEAITDDPEGERFPWRDTAAAEAAAPTEAKTHAGPDSNAHPTRPKMMWRLVDDAVMAEKAQRMPLTQEGFQEVVSSKSIIALRQFLRRVIAIKGWEVKDDAAFSEFVWDKAEAGTAEGDDGLKMVLETLSEAPWICKTPEGPSDDEKTTFDSKKKDFASRKATAAASKHPEQAATSAGEPGAEHAAEEKLGTVGKGAHHGVGVGSPSVHQAIPPPIPTGKGGGPKGGGAKGAKGGKPKGPPLPGAAAQQPVPSSPDGKGEEDKEGHEESPGDAAPVGGPGGKKGKGKGPPVKPAVPGKGKAKGKGKSGDIPPTRDDKSDWLEKRTPLLRWKRFVRGHEGLDKSLFAGWKEGNANLQELASWADERTLVRRATTRKETRKMVKPPVWEPTERQDPAKRRLQVAFLMKSKWKDAAQDFLTLLEEHNLLGIKAKFDDEDEPMELDAFVALVDFVASISKTEWDKLADPVSVENFDWDDVIEGFFSQLHRIPKHKVLMDALHSKILLDQEIKEVMTYMTFVEDGLMAVQNCDLLHELCRIILCIGNHLNAGEAKFARADGFDVIDLVDGQLLKKLPKARDVALMTHLHDVEVTPKMKAALKELAEALEPWKPLGVDEVDPADIGEFKNDIGRLSRSLTKSQTDLKSVFSQDMPPMLVTFMDSYKKQRQEIDLIMTRLDELPESLLEVQNLLQESKKDGNVGRILRALAKFAHDLSS